MTLDGNLDLHKEIKRVRTVKVGVNRKDLFFFLKNSLYKVVDN